MASSFFVYHLLRQKRAPGKKGATDNESVSRESGYDARGLLTLDETKQEADGEDTGVAIDKSVDARYEQVQVRVESRAVCHSPSAKRNDSP